MATSAKIDDGTIQNADIGDGQIQYIKLNINDGDIPNAKIDGLGSAALADIGVNAGMVMGADAVPHCAANQKLQMSPGSVYTWSCVDDSTAEDDTKLPLAGGTMAGGINMDGNVIENLPAPDLDGDAATKKYVDDGLEGIDESKWDESGSDIYYSSGNVGIGTASVNDPLHVNAGVGNSRAVSVGHSDVGPALNLIGTGSQKFFRIDGHNTGGSPPNRLRFLSATGNVGSEVFTERMTILNSGNVGIGATAPSAKLEVAGQVKITGGSPGAGKVLSSDGSGLASWVDLPSSNAPSGSASGELFGDYPDPVIADGVIDDDNVVSGANINATKLGTGVIDNTEFNYLNGVTSAIQTQFGNKVSLGGDTMTGTLNLPSNGLNVGADELVVNGGNVGIGTTLPSTKLEVDGGILSTGASRVLSTGEANSVMETASTGVAANRYINNNVEFKNGVGIAGIDGYVIREVSPSPGQHFTVQSGGNIGIGTTNPQGRLAVNGQVVVGDVASPLGALRVRSSESSLGDLLAEFYYNDDAGTNPRLRIRGASNKISLQTTHTTGGVDLSLKNDALMIKEGGNVGVGTTNPSAKLDVKKQTGNTGQFLIRANESRGADGGAHHKAFSIAGNDEDIVEIGALSTFTTGSPSLDHFYINANKSEISAGSGHSTPDFVIDDIGNIGVGVVSPGEKLDVDGNVKATSFFGDGSQLTNVGATSSEAASNYVINADSDGDTNGEIQFQIDGVTQGVMDNAGNMALGQTTASAKLDVASSTGSVAQFNMADNTSGNFVLRQDTNEYMNVDTSDGAEAIKFGNTTTDPNFLFEGGNLGIGTGTPKQKLSIVGLNTPESFPGSGEGAPESLFQLRSADCTVDTGPTMLFSTHYSGSNPSTGASISAKREVGCSSGTSFNNHYLAFNVSNYPDTLQEKMRITSVGNVGIGTSSPSFMLDVNEDAKIGSNSNGEILKLASERSWVFKSTGTGESTSLLLASEVSNKSFDIGSDDESFKVASFRVGPDASSSKVSFVESGGSVGIGTNSPDAKLTVESGPDDLISRFHSLSAEDVVKGIRINAQDSGGVNTYFDLAVDPLGDKIGFGIGSSSGSLPIGDGDLAQAKMVIDNTGNVGIGTNSPTAKLNIAGKALINGGDTSGLSDGYLKIDRVGNYGDEIGILLRMDGEGDANSNGVFDLGADDIAIELQSDAGGDPAAATTKYRLWSDGSAFFNGNIGVGTTQPSQKLDVQGGNLRVGGPIPGDSAWGTQSDFQASTALSGLGYIETPWIYTRCLEGDGRKTASTGICFSDDTPFTDMDEISLFTQGNSRLLIESSGRVGVGVTNPQAQMHVDTSSGRPNLLVSSGGADIATPDGEHMQFGHWDESTASFTERMRMTNSGNMGIGDTTPSYLLDVAGDINSSTRLRIAGTQVCTSTGCTSSSDARLKEQVVSLEDPLKRILELEGVQYEYADKERFDDQKHVGVIAQDVERVFPEVVKTDSKTGLKSVAYGHLVAPLIEAVKSFYREFVADKKENKRDLAQLKDENERLKEENDQIKSYLCQKDPEAPFCSL